jgi:hypothetical protein
MHYVVTDDFCSISLHFLKFGFRFTVATLYHDHIIFVVWKIRKSSVSRNIVFLCEILSSHGGEYEDESLLGYSSV